MNHNDDKNTVRLFATGGCACNIASKIRERKLGTTEGQAKLKYTFVDTSRSDLNKNIKENEVYVIRDDTGVETDGSGGMRRTHSKKAQARAKEIIKDFPPCGLNILLHSASGGSGSVLAQLLIQELMERDAPVIVIAVGDSSTYRYASNTLDTLKSYHAIVKKLQKPIVMAVFQNHGTARHAETDDFVINLVGDLLYLFSGENASLDSQDLKNWLNFDVPTQYDPQLAHLSTVLGNESLESYFGDPIAVATLAEKNADADYPCDHLDYQVIGYIPDDSFIQGGEVLHFVITDGVFNDIAFSLNKTLDSMKEARAAKPKTPTLLDTDDDVDPDTGLVL